MSDEIEHDKPDTITRLRDENERLRAALREAENALADYVPTLEKHGAIMGYGRKVLAIARAALEGK